MIRPLQKGESVGEAFAICPEDTLVSSAGQVHHQERREPTVAPGRSLCEQMLARMVNRAQARPGSYAHDLIVELHADIFVRSLDLKADYLTYFAVEYATFADYLRRRERLVPSDVAVLAAAFDRSAAIIRFEPWHAFLREEYGLKFLTTLLEEESS